MTLSLLPPSSTIRTGDTPTLSIHSTEPGTVTLTSSNPAVATVAASVVIAGTRERWLSAIGNGIACVADATDALSARGEAADRCATFCVDLDLRSDVFRRARGYYGGFMTIAGSYRDTGAHSNNLNWALLSYDDLLDSGGNQYYLRYAHSPTPNSNPLYLTGTAAFSPATGVNRIILVMDQTNLYIYLNDGVTPILNNAHAQASGVMSSPVFFQLRAGRRAAYYMGVMSQADRVAWMAGSTPAGAVSSWSCAQEPTPGEVIYDLVGVNDLTAGAFTDQSSGDYSLPLQDYTDTTTVVPVSTYGLTAVSAGTTTITATRRRQGVPDRATDEEKFETTTLEVTVEAGVSCFAIGPDVVDNTTKFPATRRLTVFSQTPGAVALESDDARVLVPSSVVVADGFAVFTISIAAEVSGVTITATQGAESDTCNVSMSLSIPAAPEMAANDTLQLFPEWLWSEPHAQGVSAVMDDRRAEFVNDLAGLLIFDFDNQTTEMLDQVADMFGIFGWSSAASEVQKVEFLKRSLDILRKSGTPYAVKAAINLIAPTGTVEEIRLIEGAGGLLYDGTWDYDGTEDYDSDYHWAKFDVEIDVNDDTLYDATMIAQLRRIIEFYKPLSRWLNEITITEV